MSNLPPRTPQPPILRVLPTEGNGTTASKITKRDLTLILRRVGGRGGYDGGGRPLDAPVKQLWSEPRLEEVR